MMDPRPRMGRLGTPDVQRRTPVPVLVALSVLSAWIAAYFAVDAADRSLSNWLPFDGIAPDIAFILAGLLLIARGVRSERGWILVGVGSLCWAAGDIYWTLALAKLSAPPVPSWADAGYLMFCPLTFAGIVMLVRRRARAAPRTLIADACAAALAVGGISAALVVQPVLAHASGGTWAVATNLAYPLVDLLLLGLIVGAVALDNWRLHRLWLLLAAAVLAFWVADSLYLVTVAKGTYQQDAWFNPLWYASPVIAAWAAWLPHKPRERLGGRVSGTRSIVMPLAFGCAALGALVRSSFAPIGETAIVLCGLSLLVIMWRLTLTWRENFALLAISQEEALTDALTGLGNRRALTLELEARMETPEAYGTYALVLFDLDGFKTYNDNFGHPAGDALLERLGGAVRSQLGSQGKAYRMGGDEFCVLIDDRPESLRRAAAALTESGEGFSVGCSYGSVRLPDEANGIAAALRMADQRMYAQKRSSRLSATRQSSDVLLRAVAERNPDLGHHVYDVAALAEAVAARLSLSIDQVMDIREAGALHDIGKIAIPDAILDKPASLDKDEWAFIRRHTLIGERILLGAPALHGVAALVRSSHERFDGTGYPDGLVGWEIPLGSRIIAVCDAFDAMVTDRPYRRAMGEEPAIAELRRCAGSQFDPAVIDAFCSVLAERAAIPGAAA